MKSVLAIVAVVAVVGCIFLGFGPAPFGPRNTVTCTVTGKHVDMTKSKDSVKTHYMVSTDHGTFEVNNSVWVWVWNSDEIYGNLEVGKTYRVTTKGVKLVGPLFQRYPWIVKATGVK